MATKNKQNYAIKVDFDFSSILKEVQNMKKQFATINAGQTFSNSFTKMFKEIEDKANKFSTTISQGFSSSKELDKMILDLDKFSNLLTDVGERLNKFEIDDSELKDSNITIQKLAKNLRELNTQAKSAKEVAKETPINLRNVSGTKTETKAFSRRITAAAEAGDVGQVREETKSFLAYLDTKLQKLTEIKLIEDDEYENIQKQNKEAKEIIENLKEQAKIIREMKKEDRTPDQQGVLDTYSAAKKTERTTTPQLQKFDLSTLATQATEAEKIFIPIAQEVQISTEKVANTFSKLNTETKKATDSAKEGIEGLKEPLDKIKEGIEDVTDEVKDSSESTKSIDEVKERLEKAGNLMKKFFGLSVITNLVKNAVRSIFSDFKKLDEQFNEIAIVSDFSTSEMWDGFDRVNDMAQKYGVTAANVVSVQKLYYQQGLKTAEVNQLTAETLTLAKITGMEFAEATDQMTAAMRAFKIEAEDASLITDTFAALASGTAADAEEISNALNKTASIAASAGMSLQSTSVFLTKMIETTREAPENLGTAMKTIVARFGELKQNLAEIEVDGEIIDANKIDTALKTVGVSLRDTGGQFRDLDDVFMELSKKWDSLDRNTQRYIATTAAGSRQQSRFIAMMEDYSRTLELVTMAEESSGTGKKQLEKSMQSIQTSLNNLTSAWQDFYTNLLKSDMFKWVIDSLTGIVSVLDGMNPVLLVLMATISAGLFPVIGKLISSFIIARIAIRENTEETKANTAEEMKNTLSKEKGVAAKFAHLIATKLSTKAKAKETAANKLETKSLWAKITAKITEIGLKSLGIGLAIAAAVVVGALAIANLAEAASIEKVNEATEKSNEAINKNNDIRNKTVGTINTYNKALELHRKGLARTTSEEETYQTLLKTLSDTMPEAVEAQEDGTLAMIENKEALDELIEAKEKELALNNALLLSNARLATSYGQVIEGSPAEKTATKVYDTATALASAGKGTTIYSELEAATDKMVYGDMKHLQEGLTELGSGVFDADTLGLLTDENISSEQFKIITDYFKNNPNATLREALAQSGEYSDRTLDGLDDLNNIMGKYGTSLEDYFKATTSKENLDYVNEVVVKSVVETEAAAMGYTGTTPEEFTKAITGLVDTGFQVEAGKQYTIGTRTATGGGRTVTSTHTADAQVLKEIVESSDTLEEAKKALTTKYGVTKFSEDILEYMNSYYSGDMLRGQIEALMKGISQEDMALLSDIAASSKEGIWTEEEKAKAIEQVGSILGTDSDQYNAFLKEIVNGEESNQSKLQKQRQDLINKVNAKGLSSSKINKLDTEQLQTINYYMDELGEKGQDFGEAFNAILSDLNEEDATAFFQQFGKTNWDTSSSINQLRALGKELNIETGKMNVFIAAFDEYSSRTGFAFDTAVKEVTEDINEIKKGFELLNSSEALDAEGIQTLMALDKSLSMENFQITADGYKLIGTSTKEILQNKQAELKTQYLLNIAENDSLILTKQKEISLSTTTKLRKEELLLEIASLQNANALYRTSYSQIATIATKMSDSTKDAAKAARDLLASLKGILDVYSNINAIVDNLSNKGSLIDAQLGLTQNSEQKAKLIGEKLANSLELTAAYSAINITAEKNLQLYADSINENYSKYLTFDEDGNLIENYEAITELYKKQAAAVAAGNEDTAEAIENQISNLKDQANGYREQKGLIDENNEALLEQLEVQKELVNTQYENIKTVEDKIIEILKEQDEKELQMVEDKYNEIKEADQDYLESVQKVVDKERQIRDRANTATSYQEKLKRLALLKMDTSGVYGKEILQLEEELRVQAQEIADQRQDDLIAEEEEAAAEKAKKLDEDYTAQETALNKNKELMTVYIEEVNQLMMLGQEDLMNWLKENDTEFMTGTAAAQYLWVQEWNTNIANAKAGQVTLATALEPIQTALGILTGTTASLNTMTQNYFDTVSLNKQGATNSLNEVAGGYASIIGNIKEALIYQNKLNSAMGRGGSGEFGEELLRPEVIPGKLTPLKEARRIANATRAELTDYIAADGSVEWQTIDGVEYYYDSYNQVYLKKSDAIHNTGTRRNPESWVWDAGTQALFLNDRDAGWWRAEGGQMKKMKYAKGGIVDYTGPAWVDGTKSNPEAFLDPVDTSNIFNLSQILRKLFNNKNTPNPSVNNTENNTSKVEVNIQVGSLANDYDVDQLTTRVENNIVKASKKNTKITKVNK